MRQTCPFCNIDESRILLKGDGFIAFYDSFPVNPGHLLVVPSRHVKSYFSLSYEEKIKLWSAVDKCKEILDKQFMPDGYNVGVNVGEEAGQSIPHVHIHLIPRYSGDVKNPRGGVRGVIPEKQNY